MCRGNEHGGRRCPASTNKAKRSAQNRAYYLKHRKATAETDCSRIISEVSGLFEKRASLPGVFRYLSWGKENGVEREKDGTPQNLYDAYLNHALAIAASFDGEFNNKESSYQMETDWVEAAAPIPFDKETGSSSPMSIEAAGQIYDENKEDVGYWTRRIYFPEGEPPYAKYEILCVNNRYWGKGIGTGAVRYFDEVMKKWGVSRVEVEANMDVGGYAWARGGYDWDPAMGGDTEISWARQQGLTSALLRKRAQRNGDPDGSIAEMAARLQGPYDPLTYPTPFEVSEVGRKPGDEMWAGKEVLLMVSWHGVRKL